MDRRSRVPIGQSSTPELLQVLRGKDQVVKVLIVSTISYNPGDEFIRLGQQHLLRQIFPSAEFDLVHKHDPRSIFSGYSRADSDLWHPRLVPLQYKIYAGTKGKTQTDLLEASDLVVFAGTPFFWISNARIFPSHSGNAEWVGPIWKRLFDELPDKPVLNLAVGTSLQSQEGMNRMLTHQGARSFLAKALSRANLTTARDPSSQLVAQKLGFEIPLLPCTSLWAADGANIAAKPAEYVAVNLMRHAVHKYRATETATANWEKLATHLMAQLQKSHDVLLVCHSKDEEDVAKEWFPQVPRVYSMRPEDLLDAYSKSEFCVSNRVHGAAGAATFGRPSLVIGGDTRVQLIKQFGLPALDSRDLTIEKLDQGLASLIDHRDEYTQQLTELRNSAKAEYLGILRGCLSDCGLEQAERQRA